MIVYSVTVSLDENIEMEWLNWMKEVHIPEVMDSDCFTSNRLLKIISPTSDDSGPTYNIQYDCESMAILHKYQAQFAPKLQKDHSDKFNGKFVAFRSLLEKI